MASLAEVPRLLWRRRWQRELDTARPYLFNLAWQLVEAYPRRRWDVLVCDDVSARLPAVFISRVFEHHGMRVAVRHVAGGKVAREQTPQSVYDAYLARHLGGFGRPRVLVLTESAGEFNALQFLADVARPHASSVDFAIVASHYVPPARFGLCYVGGFGERVAARATFRAFEFPRLTLAQRAGIAKPFDGGVLVNLRDYPDPGRPFVEGSENPRFLGLARYCHRRMEELADAYSQIPMRYRPPTSAPVLAPLEISSLRELADAWLSGSPRPTTQPAQPTRAGLGRADGSPRFGDP